MAEDNTPTVTARRRKPIELLRLRLETARRLQGLNAQSKAKRKPAAAAAGAGQGPDASKHDVNIAPRVPKVKKNMLSHPAKPPSKFKKRQRHKTWLPTHMFHAKRAHMTSPEAALWRFAVPLTPTEKSYRPTHRASGARGAIAWDMSYISTIKLEGVEASLESLLKALGVEGDHAWGSRGKKWRAGTRSLEPWLFERDGERRAIAPVTIIWAAAPTVASADAEIVDAERSEKQVKNAKAKKATRKLFVRVHPSAFLQLWEEVMKVSKIQRPQVMIEDLRFEIGSIDVTGPGSAEALLAALKPAIRDGGDEKAHSGSPEKVWTSLSGLTNAASLPLNALLSFNISDPLLRYPPQTIKPPNTDDSYTALATLLSSWTPDTTMSQPDLFSRPARLAASRSLPSQKAINRRKGLASPGEYPPDKPTDPSIPVIVLASRPGGAARDSNSQGCWTVLLPWKCVTPVWYSIIYYPLSSGGNPRFGGLQEKQQLAFESGVPWFPGDFPGTKAGWEWEQRERETQRDKWERKPKGKRMEFGSLDLENDQTKGELGLGWACDWERLLTGPNKDKKSDKNDNSRDAKEKQASAASSEENVPIPLREVRHLAPSIASYLLCLKPKSEPLSPSLQSAISKPVLATVKITISNRGTPAPRARVYRLPSTDTALRAKWHSVLLDQSTPPSKANRNKETNVSKYKESLVFPPLAPDEAKNLHPPIPSEHDLIGFVTTGNYNLSAGRGTGIGAVLVNKILSGMPGTNTHDGEKEDETRVFRNAVERFGKDKVTRMCIVRSAGERVGRLGVWEVA